MQTAVVFGGSGAVGREVWPRLVASDRWRRVVCVVRRRISEAEVLEQREVDFERLSEVELPGPVGAGFCALGTTRRKAGSIEAFRRVDLDYVVASAKLIRRHGGSRFVVVSSLGADPASRNDYLRTKGEMEQALGQCGFERLVILRPSLLLAERDELRPAEAIAGWVSRGLGSLFVGPLRRLRPVGVTAVAAAMLEAERVAEPGVTVLENDEIRALAGGGSS